MKYDDHITNWITNTQSGSSYTIANSAGDITSKGFEISNKTNLEDYTLILDMHLLMLLMLKIVIIQDRIV